MRAFRLRTKLLNLSVNRGIILEIFSNISDPQSTVSCDSFENNIIVKELRDIQVYYIFIMKYD